MRFLAGIHVVVLGFLGVASGALSASQRGVPAPSGPVAASGAIGAQDPSRGPGTVVSQRKISNAEGGFPDTLEAGVSFGQGLAALGDLDGDGVGELAIGAPKDHVAGNRYRGALWILFPERDGSLRARQKIGAGQGGLTRAPLEGGEFGCALAALGDLDGDGHPELAVGNRYDPTDGHRRGAVWLLSLAADGTVARHRKIGSGMGGFSGPLANGDAFGSSLATLGDLDGDGVPELAVGAAGDDEGGSSAGAVWLLFLERDGRVRAQRRIGDLQLGGLDAGDQFGTSAAGVGDLDGDGLGELAVGASFDDDGGSEHGAVWVLFLAPDGSLRARQKISATEGGFTGVLGPDLFGCALAALGDGDGDGTPDLAVGADFDDDGGYGCGALWLLSLDAGGRVQAQQKISALEGGFTGELLSYDRFGSSAAALGDLDGNGVGDVLVGAQGDRDGGDFDRGAAWILFLEPDGTVASHHKISDRPGSFEGTLDFADGFGTSVVALGDLDGDGIGDLAVGAEGDEDGGPQTGAVWILFLRDDGTVRTYQKISATHGGFGGGLDTDDRFGRSLASAGDVDGDGVPDLFVGANRDDDGGPYDRGAVWLLFLRRDGTVKAQRKFSATQDGTTGLLPFNSFFGYSLSAPGDLDDDGVADLVVGALLDDDGGPDRGAVWVLFLRPDGSIRTHQKISALEGGFAGPLRDRGHFGSALAALGDLDGDGRGELAVGASADDGGGVPGGAVWVLFLRPDGTVEASRRIGASQGGFRGELDAYDLFGSSLTSAGDLDGDGLCDLVVGAVGDDDGGGRYRGALWVLFLAADGSVKAQRKISSTTGGFGGFLNPRDQFGSSLAFLGDRDGDGVGDLAVGAVGDGDGGEYHGALWLLSLDGIATLDFETGDDALHRPLVDGLELAAGRAFGRTLRLAGAGANLGPALFDSTPLGPNDPSQDRDLLVDLGNLLVLQDSLAPLQSVPGVFDRPNDDADGGKLTFTFQRPPVALQSLDLVDIDGGRRQSATVTLLDHAGRERCYSIPAGWTEDLLADGPPGRRTLDLTTLLPQNGFASTAIGSESRAFDPNGVVCLVVELGSSGAVDNLRWDPHPDR